MEEKQCINETYLYIIESCRSGLKTSKYTLEGNNYIKKLFDDFCKILDDESLSTIDIKYKYKALVYNIKNHDSSFFDDYDYVDDIKSSYKQFCLIDNNSLITKERIKNGEIETYLNELYLAYCHSKTRNKLNSSVLAYSHRKTGWNTDNFKLDSNFNISIITNFGYGHASYFDLLIRYKNINIIPYTKIIYYRYANASSILHCTEDYRVSDDSWEVCYNFVVNEVNKFNNNGSQSFIREHIVKSIDDLCNLINKILKTDVFYFVDIDKLNSYLDLNNKSVIYDYEHLLRNVNPYAINETALREFVMKYKELSNFGYLSYNDKNILKELSNPIFNSYAKYEMSQSDINKEKYGYAIAMLLSKYYLEFNEWGDISDNTYSERIQSIVKRIIDIEGNFNILLYRYSGFNLISFRNERMSLCIDLFDSIESLHEIIDSKSYITRIKENAEILSNQNNEFYIDLLPKWSAAKEEYDDLNKKYQKVKEIFDNSIVAKKDKFFNEIFTKINCILSYFKYNQDNETFSIYDGLDDKYNELVLLIKGNCDELGINISDITHLNEYGSECSYFYFSIGRLRKNWETASEKDKNKKLMVLQYALEMNKISQELFDYLLELNEQIDTSVIIDKIKAYNLKKKQVEQIDSVQICSFDMTYYKECFISNCEVYINNKKEYDDLIKPLYELKTEINKLYDLYDNLNSQKESIEKWNEKIKEKIQK